MITDTIVSMLPSPEMFYNTSSQLNKTKVKSIISNLIVNVASVIKLVSIFRQNNQKNDGKNAEIEDHHVTYSCCELRHISQTPAWAQEPFVTDGYLPSGKPVRYYLRAIYTRNYELMNVWTNIIPFFLFAYMLHEYNQELDLIKAWPLMIIICASMILMVFSGTAHTFHSKSETWHRNCFLLDYFGIMIYASCSTTADWFASSSLYHYNFLKSNNMSLLMMISIVGYLCMASTKCDVPLLRSPRMQRYIKVGINLIGYLYGMSPVIYRILVNEITEEAKYYHMLQFLFMLLNPILFASDFPQKYWPGRFNTFFHSHQLFHISVALSCFFNILAIHAEIVHQNGMWKTLSIQPDYPTIMDFLMMLTFLFATSFMAVLYLNCKTFKTCNEEKKKQD